MKVLLIALCVLLAGCADEPGKPILNIKIVAGPESNVLTSVFNKVVFDGRDGTRLYHVILDGTPPAKKLKTGDLVEIAYAGGGDSVLLSVNGESTK